MTAPAWTSGSWSQQLQPLSQEASAPPPQALVCLAAEPQSVPMQGSTFFLLGLPWISKPLPQQRPWVSKPNEGTTQQVPQFSDWWLP